MVEISNNLVEKEQDEVNNDNKKDNSKSPLNHIKSVVSLQNIVRDMDNTSRMLSYGLVIIFIIMIVLFVILTLNK